MNGNIKGTIVKVKRNSFVNKESGELVNYCRFCALVQGPVNDDELGLDYEVFSCKFDHFGKIVEFIKLGKAIDITCSFVKQTDGNYKRVVKKLDNYTL